MSSEFELILHHTYASWGGLPVDLSDYDSHGRASLVDFLPDGATPGSGALTFNSKNSRVSVRSTPAQRSVTALKVEVTARLRHLLPGLIEGTLVAGDQSFEISVFPGTNDVGVSFVGNPADPKTFTYGLNSLADGVVSPRWKMPFGQWVQLAIVHDGSTTIRLYADRRLVAERSGVPASVPPVGFRGISIGNAPDENRHQSFLGSDIDEVKVSRLDPNLMDRQFVTRPMTNDVVACWRRFFASLGKALQQHPECARQMNAAFLAIIDELRRAILAHGAEGRERYIRTCIRYRHLWKQGRLDDLAMAELVAEWLAWLRLTGFSFHSISGLAVFLRNQCLRDILPLCAPLGCDRQFLVFIAFVTGIIEESGSTLQEGLYGG